MFNYQKHNKHMAIKDLALKLILGAIATALVLFTIIFIVGCQKLPEQMEMPLPKCIGDHLYEATGKTKYVLVEKFSSQCNVVQTF